MYEDVKGSAAYIMNNFNTFYRVLLQDLKTSPTTQFLLLFFLSKKQTKLLGFSSNYMKSKDSV